MPVIIFNKHQDFDASWCDEVINVMRPNILGNPFPIIGRNSRDFVIKSYADYLQAEMGKPDSLQRKEIERLRELHLKGENVGLICCCTPLPCHADVIKSEILKLHLLAQE